ncbi:MAG: DUF1320 domain-containing protein [Candidatus Kapaibacterium sp.]
MLYIDLVYIKARVDDTTLKNLTKEKGGADEIDEALVTARIADAESLVDSKLVKRYSVPLTTAPANIKQITYDITLYYLYKTHRTHKMDEEIKFGYEQAIKELNRIEDGKSNLVGVSELTSSPSKVLVYTNTKASDRKFNKSFLTANR